MSAREPGALARTAGLIAQPIALCLGRLSPTMRQSLGWVAILTLFHAGIVWAYVLLKGPVTYDEPLGKQPTLVDAEGHPVVEVIGRTPPPPPPVATASAEGGHGEKPADSPKGGDHAGGSSGGGH